MQHINKMDVLEYHRLHACWRWAFMQHSLKPQKHDIHAANSLVKLTFKRCRRAFGCWWMFVNLTTFMQRTINAYTAHSLAHHVQASKHVHPPFIRVTTTRDCLWMPMNVRCTLIHPLRQCTFNIQLNVEHTFPQMTPFTGHSSTIHQVSISEYC